MGISFLLGSFASVVGVSIFNSCLLGCSFFACCSSAVVLFAFDFSSDLLRSSGGVFVCYVLFVLLVCFVRLVLFFVGFSFSIFVGSNFFFSFF